MLRLSECIQSLNAWCAPHMFAVLVGPLWLESVDHTMR
jgi:hypothetical protein